MIENATNSLLVPFSTGPHLAPIPRLPLLMIVNACQTAHTRQATRKPGVRTKKPRNAAPGRTIAETMFCAGIANFIGTYWPVGDDSAGRFARKFCTSLIANKTLGDALIEGRRAISGSEDWPNYVLYGNPSATLDPGQRKQPKP